MSYLIDPRCHLGGVSTKVYHEGWIGLEKIDAINAAAFSRLDRLLIKLVLKMGFFGDVPKSR